MSGSTLARLAVVAACLMSLVAWTQDAPPPSQATPDPWPKSATQNGTQYTIFQPQLDRWDDYHYEAHAAVQVIPAGTKSPVFGVIEITATTIVDRPNRVVHIENLKITEAKFPSQPQQASALARRDAADRLERALDDVTRAAGAGGQDRGRAAEVEARPGGEPTSADRVHPRRRGAGADPR